MQRKTNYVCIKSKFCPSSVNEDTFWRNYFYRVSLLKQFVEKGDSLAKHDWLSSRSSSGEGPDEITVNDDSVNQNYPANELVVSRQNDNDNTSQQTLHKQESQGTSIAKENAMATNAYSATSQLDYQDMDESSKLLAEADDLNSKLKELNISFDEDGTPDG